MIFVGIDWAEAHHDICVVNEDGSVLAKGRVPEGFDGVAKLHEVVGSHADEPSEVIVGIELDRGLLVGALVAAGYSVHAINPLSVNRYRDRHRVSGAKSDPGDARVLADLVRTDRHLHREVAGDSDLAEGVKILARGHQSLIWSRQRHLNHLRSALREFFPAALEAFGTDLASPDALAVLGAAPTPAQGRALGASRIAAALKRGGRTRGVSGRAEEIRTALRSTQLEAPDVLSRAYGEVVRATVRVVGEMNEQIEGLQRELEARFEEHPDAEILRSLPGLGPVLGARVLAEFGDDRTRYADPKARKNYAGTSPITKASGRSRVALARFARNRRLADALDMWAFCSLTTSVGARRLYDAQRNKGKTHRQALRALANRWVGILHGCLRHRLPYREDVAWPGSVEVAA
ncbi:MAG TPA: IS110 family transposase [Actinomycetota bacterium]|nr:IS110 family transposase [Actinomycetota bacterium]